MLDRLDRLHGRDAVVAAAGGHPYARLTATGDVVGYRGDGLLGWVGTGPWGPLVCATGAPAAALEFVGALWTRGATDGANWLHVPRTPVAAAAAALPVVRQDDWDFLWTATAPPRVPGESGVVTLGVDDGDAIEELLAAAFPDTTTRPGDPRIRGWHGIRDNGGLVAAGADRSRGGVGFLAGLAVHPDHRRRGLGAALTAAMTRRLHDEFGLVSLGVMADDDGPRRLYERLGYRDALARSSLALAR